jgi:hypothetical protein
MDSGMGITIAKASQMVGRLLREKPGSSVAWVVAIRGSRE